MLSSIQLIALLCCKHSVLSSVPLHFIIYSILICNLVQLYNNALTILNWYNEMRNYIFSLI